MFESVKKIVAVLLMVAMNAGGLTAVFGTRAYFSDTEVSYGNTFRAGTVDVFVASSEFSPAIDSDTGDFAKSVLVAQNIGSLPFDYQISVATTTEESLLCPRLEIAVSSDQGETFSAPAAVETFATSSSMDSGATKNLVLRATLKDGVAFADAAGKTCEFVLSVDAWQSNLSQGQGFNDRQEISAVISAADININKSDAKSDGSGGIVINEVLPDPIGDDAAAMPGGEWVELYNAGSQAVDVDGWAIYTNESTHIYALTIYSGNTNNGSTIIYPGGFLVVFRNADQNFKIKNNGHEEIKLYNAPIGFGGTMVDMVSFNANDCPEGKSLARIPDGAADWVDPIPTPGAANKLSEEELLILQGVSDNQPGEEETQSGAASSSEGDEQTNEGVNIDLNIETGETPATGTAEIAGEDKNSEEDVDEGTGDQEVVGEEDGSVDDEDLTDQDEGKEEDSGTGDEETTNETGDDTDEKDAEDDQGDNDDTNTDGVDIGQATVNNDEGNGDNSGTDANAE